MENEKSNRRRIPIPDDGIYIDLDNLRKSNTVPSFIRLAATLFQKSKGYVQAGTFLRDLSDDDIAWLLGASAEFSKTVEDARRGRRFPGKGPLMLENNDQFFIMFCHIMALGEGLPISMMGRDLAPLTHQVSNLLKLEQISRVDKHLKLNYRRLAVDPNLSFPSKKEEVRPYQDREWFVAYINDEEPGLQKVFAKVNDCYLSGKSPDLLKIFADTLLGGMSPESVAASVRRDPGFASRIIRESERKPGKLDKPSHSPQLRQSDQPNRPNRPTWDF